MAENDCQGEDPILVLVGRLRVLNAREAGGRPFRYTPGAYKEAADALISLYWERDRLREALAPFAEVAERHLDDDPNEWPCDGTTLEDARRARAALNKEPPCQGT